MHLAHVGSRRMTSGCTDERRRRPTPSRRSTTATRIHLPSPGSPPRRDLAAGRRPHRSPPDLAGPPVRIDRIRARRRAAARRKRCVTRINRPSARVVGIDVQRGEPGALARARRPPRRGEPHGAPPRHRGRRRSSANGSITWCAPASCTTSAIRSSASVSCAPSSHRAGRSP